LVNERLNAGHFAWMIASDKFLEALGDSFVPDKPRIWSERVLTNTANATRNVDLAPDGKRVVAVIPAEGGEGQQSRNHVVFLENFFDELRRRAPIGK
jgi:hypothetical protein